MKRIRCKRRSFLLPAHSRIFRIIAARNLHTEATHRTRNSLDALHPILAFDDCPTIGDRSGARAGLGCPAVTVRIALIPLSRGGLFTAIPLVITIILIVTITTTRLKPIIPTSSLISSIIERSSQRGRRNSRWGPHKATCVLRDLRYSIPGIGISKLRREADVQRGRPVMARRTCLSLWCQKFRFRGGHFNFRALRHPIAWRRRIRAREHTSRHMTRFLFPRKDGFDLCAIRAGGGELF